MSFISSGLLYVLPFLFCAFCVENQYAEPTKGNDGTGGGPTGKRFPPPLLFTKKEVCTFAPRKKRLPENQSAMDAISFIHEQMSKKTEFPPFRSGDTVIVDYRITEGEKSRIQQFRGDVIQIKGEGSTKTFTVRKISNGIGVERIFPLMSPSIDTVKIVKNGKVRRSRLFYLRDRVGKKARIKERRVK